MPVATNILGHNRSQLEGYFANLGQKPYRARQVMKWAHKRAVLDFTEMTDLAKQLRAQLLDSAELRLPTVVGDQVSTDGTRKWLVQVDAGNSVEMVYIPDGERGTLCVSSQVGCALNCSFCATALQGFNRNLTAAEIIGQLWLANSLLPARPDGGRSVTNVVMMGMGEPLLNFDAVTAAMDLMTDDLAWGMARRRVTLSTAGVVPKIDRLRERCPVALAISLHAPDNDLRDELVPINRTYPIEELLEACKRYIAAGSARERITFEYVMMAGFNDSMEDAARLIHLMRGIKSKINLIPYNENPERDIQRPS
ncbi:MAG: 23S rRNA (adenine(2503)-C(2))-methyltransferase RlmN, partial [Chromatiales bacterium]|nr:23S rRNA (adenine(2503)-C(2))-methyltransferase RlmN [Chromatiales bacterium]